MIIEYLFSSPEGDILLHPEDLRKPFLISPSKKHPFLFLGDYLFAIKKFIIDKKSGFLIRIFEKHANLNHVKKIKITSQKHGILYHISSVEITARDETRKLCIVSALSQKAKEYMSREFELLRYLREKFSYNYIPEAFFMDEIECNTGNGSVSFLMTCTEWFEDYHEWHLASNNGQVKPYIWDLKRGYRFVNPSECFHIFEQIAFILTIYYNMSDYRQIQSWHNSAGDFIVGIKDGIIDVRLTTVRRYESLTSSPEEFNPMISILYFFLMLTLKIRLDRLDGINEIVWAPSYSIEATLKGFFRALKTIEKEGRYNLGKVEDLISLLKSFNNEEMQKLYGSCINLYCEDDPEIENAIPKGLKQHVFELQQCINDFFV